MNTNLLAKTQAAQWPLFTPTPCDVLYKLDVGGMRFNPELVRTAT